MYHTKKYNNGRTHDLDTFASKAKAIESAKALHHPDWPCWQGIIVIDDRHPKQILFDSSN